MPLKLYLSALNLSFSWLNLGLLFCDGPWPSCFCRSSYLRTCLYFLSEPITNRLPQRHHQEFPPNHNSPPTSTFSTVLSFEDSPIFSPSLNSPTTTPKVLAVSIDPDVPHIKQNKGFNRNYFKNFFFLWSPFFTDFLSLNPPQYKWSHHKQDSLITTSKISHFLLQLRIKKSYKQCIFIRSASSI